MKYCNQCGQKVQFGPVPDDEMERYFCPECKTVHYQNPNVIVGCIPRWQEQILMCKRAIEPRYGKWTLPAGFFEIGEKVEAGAARETLEEANARVEIVRLFSVYSLPQVGQVYLIFLANLLDLNFCAGHESLDVKLFKPEEIPWDEMAFSAVSFAIKNYIETMKTPTTEVFFGSL